MTRLGGRWRSFCDRGLMATVRAIVNRYVYRSHRFIVIRFDLAGPPAVDRVGDVVFRLATASDLDHLEEFEPYGRGSKQRNYVSEDDDWLFVACHGDRIVATRRYGRELPSAARDGHGLMPRVLRFEQGEVWSADAYWLPEYRNQGLNAHFAIFTMRFLASRGYTRQFATITVDNIPSIRSSRRRGSTLVYYVSYTRLLFYERLRISEDFPEQFRDWARARSHRAPGTSPPEPKPTEAC